MAKGRPQWKKNVLFRALVDDVDDDDDCYLRRTSLGGTPSYFVNSCNCRRFNWKKSDQILEQTIKQIDAHTPFFFSYDTPIIELTIDIAKQCHLICHPIKF